MVNTQGLVAVVAKVALMLLVAHEAVGRPQAPGFLPPSAPYLPAAYEFGYEVQDPEFGNSYGHTENRAGDSTSGQYSVLLPDGRTQVVSYTVNGDSGYIAEVSYQ